jgi:MYXO-CTERM domain-containing protein
MRKLRSLLLCLALPTLAVAQVTKSTVMVTVPNCNPMPALTTYPADVYRPAGSGPFALVGIAHGFQNSKDNHEVLARELAGRGMVVVVPQFPLLLALQCGATDHARNATILIAAIDQQIAGGGIDTAHIGVAGHSAGGLSAFLAASQRSYAGVVLLDAVDQNNQGAMAVANVAEPVIALSTTASQCNSQNNSGPWYAGLTGPKATLRVVGSSHCEPQDPVNALCTGGCSGTVVPARQALFKKYAVSFFDRFLRGVNAPCLEALAAADEMAGTISMVDLQLGGCPANDAGVEVDAGVVDGGAADAGVVDAGPADAGAADAGSIDAGEADAGSIPDAGTMADAGSTSSDAGAPPAADAGSTDAGVDTTEPPRGCGCSSGAALAWLGLVGFAARRRRR